MRPPFRKTHRFVSLSALRALLTACVLTSVCVLVSASVADTVRGYVVEPIAESAVPDVEIAFSLLGKSSGLNEILRKTADENGRFEFSGPFLKPGLAFTLTAFYEGVPYPSSLLKVGEQSEIVLEVFEPTNDPSDIHVTAEHLFLTLQDGTLEVAQLLQIDNTGDRTFVGTEHGKQERVTEFRIPKSAFGLESHSGELVRADARRLFDSQPLAPGTTQIGFSFKVSAVDFAGEYIHNVLYPTQVLDVYVHPSDIHLDTPFIDRGTTSSLEREYHLYRLENLRPGQTNAIPLPLAQPMRWALKWLALGLAIVAVAAALLTRRSSSPLPEEEEKAEENIEPLDPGIGADASLAELEQRRQSLLAQLVALESGGSRKSRKAGAQGHKRQRLMGQAVAVYELLEKARKE